MRFGFFCALTAAWVTFSVSAQIQNPDFSQPTTQTNAAEAVPVSNAVENSVVKVFATVRYPDYYKPWTKQSPSELTASGVVIEGKRILSNAHAVSYASQVQIQASQAGDKISATVVAIAPGIDLAVLKLDDESFFDTHPPLPRTKTLAQIKDVVMVYGYPKGGTSLSITKGIVSRIEFAGYNAGTSGLRIQIDAAINPGNSGGPAVVDDKMIGLAFSHLSSSELIGYIIPNEEIDLFLADIADGHYDGKPALHEDLQTLQNGALRSYLKLPPGTQGIVVNKENNDTSSSPLKKWDVITKIADKPLDDEGMVRVNNNWRVLFSYYIQHDAKNDKIPLTVVRSGKELHLEVPVEKKRPTILPTLNGAYPSYFVYGPLVFSTATTEFISGFNALSRTYLNAAGSALFTRQAEKPAFPGEELVVVASPLFPHKLAKGYSSPQGEVVTAVNGKPVKNLKHFVELLRDLKDEYVRFDFDQHVAETLVFPRAEMMAATDEILNDNGLRSQGSPDVMGIWNQAKTSK